jgi:hypothetical protein
MPAPALPAMNVAKCNSLRQHIVVTKGRAQVRLPAGLPSICAPRGCSFTPPRPLSLSPCNLPAFQDWDYLVGSCFELTLELWDVKGGAPLQQVFQENLQSLLQYPLTAALGG